MFGEVFDANPELMSRYTTEGDLQATLDFGFQAAARGFAEGKPTTGVRDLFAGDDYYTDTDSNAYQLPTFLGNHDMGRIGSMLDDTASGDDLLARTRLANQLMYLVRGQPVVYYGDEQGFIGDGGDKDARQDMFASQVASYNDDEMIGGVPTGSRDRFGTDGPLYQTISELGALRDRAPGAGRRRPGAPLRVRLGRHLRVQPGLARQEAGRVPGGRQQLRPSRRPPTSRPGAATTGGSRSTAAAAGCAPTPRAASPSRCRRCRCRCGGRPTPSTPRRRCRRCTSPRRRTARSWAAAPRSRRSCPRTPTRRSRSPTGRWGRRTGRTSAPTTTRRSASSTTSATWPTGRCWSTAPCSRTRGAGCRRAAATAWSASRSAAATAAAVAASSRSSSRRASPWPATTTPRWAARATGSRTAPRRSSRSTTNDEIWKGEFDLPAGSFAYKAALNGNWDENYGAGGAPNGGNISYTAPGTPVSFYYEHSRHYVTSDAEHAIMTLAGSFQSELGCSADWAPDCMRGWLIDPDGDGVATYATSRLPAGGYEVKVAEGLSWDVNYGAGGAPNGANIPFTVAAGTVVRFSYDMATHVLTVTSAAPGATPDLAAAKAHWVAKDLLAWPADALPPGTTPRAAALAPAPRARRRPGHRRRGRHRRPQRAADLRPGGPAGRGAAAVPAPGGLPGAAARPGHGAHGGRPAHRAARRRPVRQPRPPARRHRRAGAGGARRPLPEGGQAPARPDLGRPRAVAGAVGADRQGRRRPGLEGRERPSRNGSGPSATPTACGPRAARRRGAARSTCSR